MGFFRRRKMQMLHRPHVRDQRGGALAVEKLDSAACSPGGPNYFTLAAINVPAARVPADSLQKGQAALYDQPDCSGTQPCHAGESRARGRCRLGAHAPRHPNHAVSAGNRKNGRFERGPVCINVGTGFVAQSMTVESTPDILLSTKKCRYCDLYGLSLQNMTLDGFDFSYAYLASTQFIRSSMKSVNLSHAVLAGPNWTTPTWRVRTCAMPFCRATSRSPPPPASTDLYEECQPLGATLSGVSMIDTSFYNTGALPCPASCDPSKMTSTCATAAYATMDGTQATRPIWHGPISAGSRPRAPTSRGPSWWVRISATLSSTRCKLHGRHEFRPRFPPGGRFQWRIRRQRLFQGCLRRPEPSTAPRFPDAGALHPVQRLLVHPRQLDLC